MSSFIRRSLVRILPVLLVVVFGIAFSSAQDQAAPAQQPAQEGGDQSSISGTLTDQTQAMIGGAKPLTISAGENPETRECQNLTILNFPVLERSV